MTLSQQVQELSVSLFATLLDEPAHLIVEFVLVVFVIVLLAKRSYLMPKEAPQPLSNAEQEALIRDWEPASLIDEKQRKTVEANLGNEDGAPMLVVHSSAGPWVSLKEGVEPDHLNLTTTGYLGYQNEGTVLDEAEKSLRKNGVGACGPRGFYGTVDVHLDLEKKLADFMGTPEAVLYSSGFVTIASVIPSFSKASDYLFVDKGVSFATQTGVYLARSKTFWFNHNDANDLKRLFNEHKGIFDGIHRVFVVIEGIYYNHADICLLPDFVELKKEFPFRFICEESHSIGVLGKTGRGVTEHYNLPIETLEIIAGSIGNAVGANGGFSVGDKEVTRHQRLSSSGYVFSCSLPPYVADAGLRAIDIMKQGTEISMLKDVIAQLSNALKSISSFEVVHHNTPMAHLRLKKSLGSRYQDNILLQKVVDTLRTESQIIIARSHYVSQEKNTPSPSIRIVVCAQHKAENIKKACVAIEKLGARLISEAAH